MKAVYLGSCSGSPGVPAGTKQQLGSCLYQTPKVLLQRCAVLRYSVGMLLCHAAIYEVYVMAEMIRLVLLICRYLYNENLSGILPPTWSAMTALTEL